MSTTLLGRHRVEQCAHLAQRRRTVALLADQPAADDGARATDTTPAVHVRHPTRRQPSFHGVQDAVHLIRGADAHVRDRQLVVSDADATRAGQ